MKELKKIKKLSNHTPSSTSSINQKAHMLKFINPNYMTKTSHRDSTKPRIKAQKGHISSQ